MHGPTGDALGLFPAGTCSETQESDRVCVVVHAGLALLEELGDLIQGEECQFDLIGLDLPDIGQRVCLVPGAEADQLGEEGRQVALFVVDRLRLHLSQTALPRACPGEPIEIDSLWSAEARHDQFRFSPGISPALLNQHRRSAPRNRSARHSLVTTLDNP